MTGRSQQFIDGYRHAAKFSVDFLHRRAEQMADPNARSILNSAAWALGNAAKKSTPAVKQKEAD